jgi:Holliday junction resolvasome RuvABC ATP-dependent DNA helicase subunit
MVTSNKEHTLLVEKYRSKVLDEYVGNENIKNTISISNTE